MCSGLKVWVYPKFRHQNSNLQCDHIRRWAFEMLLDLSITFINEIPGIPLIPLLP